MGSREKVGERGEEALHQGQSRFKEVLRRQEELSSVMRLQRLESAAPQAIWLWQENQREAPQL